MPVRVYWQDKIQRIMRYDIEGNWTWEEFYPEYHKALDIENVVSHRVDVIVDISETGKLPSNLLSHLRTFADNMPANVVLSVIVTTNYFLLMLYDTSSRFYPNIGKYFRIAPTVEVAQQIIAESRES